MMQTPFKNYQLEIITPVHIGNDQQLAPLMFDHQGDFVHMYAMDDVAKNIDNPRNLLDIKHGKITLRSVLSPSVIRQLNPIKKIHYWGEEGVNISSQEIELLVEEKQENFIPGSSIKGSIVHAMEFALLAQNVTNHNSSKEAYDIVDTFKNSFVVPDLYFDSFETAIQRGTRISTASGKKSKGKQRQDNYKEWLMLGKTPHFNAYFRTKQFPEVLENIHMFTEQYLHYQRSYYQYIVDKMALDNFALDFDDLQEVLKQTDRLLAINKKEEPLLILGRNTHRYSKSNELLKHDHYIKRPGKNKDHPVSRLLVFDAKDTLTIPGMVHIKKR